MLGKRMAAIGMSAVLVAALCPAMAVAAPLEAGSVQSQAVKSAQVKSIAPQASKAQTVYLVTQVTKKYPNAAQNSVMGLTTTYKYKSNGLISQRTSKQGTTNPITETLKWTYDKNNLITKVASPSRSMTFTSKNGKWKTGIHKMKSSDTKVKESYTYSGNNISKCAMTTTYTSMGKKQSVTTNTRYTYKKGRLAQAAHTSNTSKATDTYSYDNRGNLKKIVGSSMYNTTYTNSYDNKTKALKKRVEKRGSNSASVTYAYKYKKITVKNTALAKKIAAQQWAIINDNNNFALFGTTLH